jgi:glycosyltransferase involved in cell wall biosynthesis
MSKIKVLVLPSDRTGVGKFRSVDPHIFLQNLYPDDFHVDIMFDPPTNDLNFWKDYQIVHFHRVIGNNYEFTKDFIPVLNALGIVTIMDLDDYWLPTKEHPIHDLVRVHKIHEKILDNLRVAKYVITTTTLFADEIKKYNKNVVVLPNAINPKEPQFCEPTIKPEETVWYKYENIFTDNGKLISPEYQKFLYKFKEEDDSMFNDEFYHRVWTRPVQNYAKNYTKFDVSLAPIKNHVFNRVKSQLKVIEAGFYKKALIASNLGPYTIDLKHSLQHGNFVDGNALLVDEGRNHSDWFKYVKKLIDNPNWAYDLGERLYETVKDTYDLNVVTKTRAEFYKSII